MMNNFNDGSQGGPADLRVTASPPRLALALAHTVLPLELRDDVLGDLQEFVFLSYYDADQIDDSDFRRGWAKVLTIRDLSTVLHSPMSTGAETLHATWGKNWEGLERRDTASKEAIEAAIASLRADTLMTLRDLD